MEISFSRANVFDKLRHVSRDVDFVMGLKTPMWAPQKPAREITVLDPSFHPPKKGFSFAEGRARLLHDLASIELQAMELGLRTLAEFPEAPAGFREELARVTLSEAEHLTMCLESIEAEGFQWGDFPIHTALWDATSDQDTLLDRILIVHRYLEGSGLDAGGMFVKRLDSVDSPLLKRAVRQINEEEVGHVEFGSRWYRTICKEQGLDPEADFIPRMIKISTVVPKRVEKVNHDLRAKAGFSKKEIQFLECLRLWFLIPLEQRKDKDLQNFYQDFVATNEWSR